MVDSRCLLRRSIDIVEGSTVFTNNEALVDFSTVAPPDRALKRSVYVF